MASSGQNLVQLCALRHGLFRHEKGAARDQTPIDLLDDLLALAFSDELNGEQARHQAAAAEDFLVPINNEFENPF